MLELAAHDRSSADRAAQHSLVQHHPEIDRVILSDQRLAAYTDTHPFFHLGDADVRAGCMDHGLRILLGLEQTGHDERLVGADVVGGGLEADVGAGEHVAVELPPTLLARLPGDLQQLVGVFGRDIVNVQHVPNVAWSDACLSGFDAGILDPEHSNRSAT